MGVESGRQGREGGTADGDGRVAASEGEGLGGESIEMGGLDRGVSHESVVVPRLVIGDDEEDVGGLGGGEGGGAGKEGEGGEEEGEFFHDRGTEGKGLRGRVFF